jgi:hypothetical protein
MNRLAPLLIVAVVLFACGPGDVTATDTSLDPSLDDTPNGEEGVVGDRWKCGELGLVCVGGLGIGECIDDVCSPKLGTKCLGTNFAPTCDTYCEGIERSCAYLGCAGATAYGWLGDPEWTDYRCGEADSETAVPLTVACDEPLEGQATTLLCCCE